MVSRRVSSLNDRKTERQKDRKTGRHEVSKVKIQKDNKKDSESLRLTGEFQSGVRNCNCNLTAVAGIASFFKIPLLTEILPQNESRKSVFL